MRQNVLRTLLILLPLALPSCGALRHPGPAKGRVRDYYITDARGERIDSISTDEAYFYLVIDSENMHGQEAFIDLDGADNEYIFRRRYLDTTRRIKFKIRRDHQRLKVYFYNPEKWTHRCAKRRALRRRGEADKGQTPEPEQPGGTGKAGQEAMGKE
ncbi:MAG: hypothetical protein CSA07_02040 [Bacteroidia bacterium]|nr:MAG: hypothetical protein CSA07_02040 [Bacteroidia bacterium]